MKKHLFFILFLMALVLNTIPAVANDYLTIHFKDGHTERHFLKLVESISTSKYDMEGKLHDDYQTQRLVISGETYTYPLADIDSISYHKVDIEQVKKNVENIYSTVKPIFDRCPTIEKMAEHLDEIKNIEGVEEVSQSETDIVIRIRDWYDIYFTYPIAQDSDNRSLTRMFDSDNLKNLTSQIKQTKEDGSQVTVAIAFQMGDDEEFAKSKRAMLELRDNFKAMGFDVHFIPDEETGEKFDVDFYERRMFDYDIVILDTHGSYHHGKHGFYTAEKKSFLYDIGAFYEWVYDMDDISYGILDTGTFTRVSENFIKKSDYKFKSNGPHIFFNASCNNLSGDGTLTAGNGKSYKGSDVFAEILFEKGLDIYLGYNNSTNKCGYAARDYFTNMLNGASNRFAFDNLDNNLKVERAKGAVLIDLYNKKSAFENLRKLFIVKTQTIEKSQQEIDDEIIENGDVKLQGTTSVYNLDKNPTGLKYGFRLGILPHVENQNEDQNIYAKEKRYSGDESYQVIFSAGAIADPGTTVYYRAFTYDGIHYNWGEEKSFTITPLRVSTSLLSLEAGWTRTVNITSGYGNYKVESSDEDVATVSVYDYTISINALKEGDATITVTDKSGQTATIKVTVIEESINTPAEAIDLGLPSGTLWASWNLGATKPEESGDYYAWGETKRKEIYNLDTYQNWKDANGDGKLQPGELSSPLIIAGTIYDAATVNWGAEWYTPTYKQVEELLNNTTSEWVNENGVKGRRFTSNTNGNSIFLPVTGLNYPDVGCYWSSTAKNADYCGANYLVFGESYVYCSGNSPYPGFIIRPVKGSSLPDYTNSKERDNLIELYNSTNGDSWTQNDNWCSSQSPAHWYGITYDKYNEHVEYIKLANNNLTGSISIKGFEILYNIDIKGNNISSLTIDSCPKLNLGYGFRLDDITLDFLQINNCLYDMGQHFIRNANIKKILFTNFQKCDRIFLQGVVSDEVVIKDCVFDDEGVEAEDNSAVKTMIVENSTIKDGRLGGDVDELIIKNSTIGDWWVISAKSSITIINSYIEGHLIDCSGTPDEVSKYVYSVIAH